MYPMGRLNMHHTHSGGPSFFFLFWEGGGWEEGEQWNFCLLFILPLCSNGVPNTTTLLSHMLWLKLSFHRKARHS